MASEREEIVDALHQSVVEMKIARGNQIRAMVAAKDYGMTNSEISRALGVTEAAVRMYFKRNQRQLSARRGF